MHFTGPYQGMSSGSSHPDEKRRFHACVPIPAVMLGGWNLPSPAGNTPATGSRPGSNTGISWAIDKGVDLQKVRQRAGHGSLEVTSRYAAILDERDTSLADALEEIFDGSHSAAGRPERTTGLDDAADLLLPISNE
jgi:hypothetical protein